MSSLRVFASLLIILCGSITNLSAGGGWTLDKGEVWIQTSFGFINAEQVFTGTGPLKDFQRPVTDMTFQLYGEYGITKRLTLMGLPSAQDGLHLRRAAGKSGL